MHMCTVVLESLQYFTSSSMTVMTHEASHVLWDHLQVLHQVEQSKAKLRWRICDNEVEYVPA